MVIDLLQDAVTAMLVVVVALFVSAYFFGRPAGSGKTLVEVRNRSHRGRDSHGARHPS